MGAQILLYPLNIDLTGRLVVVVGGGAVAERKVNGLLCTSTDVLVRVVAPEATHVLQQHAEMGRIDWKRVRYTREMLSGAFLVFAATDVRAVNTAAAADARAMGMLVNVADDALGSTFQVPSCVRRGDLLLTVSTGGASPALSRRLRMELEQCYPPAFGIWLERVGKLRMQMQQELLSSRERTAFWRAAMRADVLDMVRNGELEKAEVELRNAALDVGA